MKYYKLNVVTNISWYKISQILQFERFTFPRCESANENESANYSILRESYATQRRDSSNIRDGSDGTASSFEGNVIHVRDSSTCQLSKNERSVRVITKVGAIKYETTIESELKTGGESPVMIKQLYPEFLGATVVCDGADQPQVCAAVIEAVTSLTGISSERITVIKMKA